MTVSSASNDALIGWVQAAGLADLAQALRHAAETQTLTPLAMFMDADWVVKAVMLALLLASVLAWAIWGGKLVQLRLASARLRRDYRRLSRHGQLGATLSAAGAVARMQRAAIEERTASQGLGAAGIKERTAIDLVRIEAGAARAMQSGVTVIGSIGSTAPFVGLFGTVWGIMNAFVGIAESGTTNLSVVAPGIAEALLATAIGLVAAIPAVLLYNHLTRVVAGYRVALADAAALVERTLSRDLDRDAVQPGPAAQTAPALRISPQADLPRLQVAE